MRAGDLFERFLDRTLPGGWRVERVEVHRDASGPRDAAGPAPRRLTKGTKAAPTARRRSWSSRGRAEVPAPSARRGGSGPCRIPAEQCRPARAPPDDGVGTDTAGSAGSVQRLRRAADPTYVTTRTLQSRPFSGASPGPGNSPHSRLCDSLRDAGSPNRLAVGERLCLLMAVESWEAIRTYIPVVLGVGP